MREIQGRNSGGEIKNKSEEEMDRGGRKSLEKAAAGMHGTGYNSKQAVEIEIQE